jgi:peptidyl-prolyl cis-trans isomerase C
VTRLSKFSSAAAAIVALLSAAPALAAEPLARINGQDITEAELNIIESELGPDVAGLPAEARRRVLFESWLEERLLADAADKAQLGAGSDFEARMKYYRLRALRDAYFEKKVRDAVGEDEAKKVYDAEVGKLKPETEVHARHILVKAEDEAKAVVGELKAGGDFVALAQKHMPGQSGASGGDLGYFTRGQMVKAFEDVAFTLDKGQVSDPVKSEFGWHVIKVEDKRDRQAPSFADVKGQILASLVRAKLQTVTQELRKSAKIEVLDASLKKAMAEEADAGSEIKLGAEGKKDEAKKDEAKKDETAKKAEAKPDEKK